MRSVYSILAVSALTLALTGGSAIAQDHHDDQDHRDQQSRHDDQNQGNGQYHHDDQNRGNDQYHHNDQNRGNEQYRHDDRDRHDHDQYVHHNDWQRGHHMRHEDWDRGQRVDDWRAHHLRQPPEGYEWRRVDGQYVCANNDGVIFQVTVGR